VKDIESDEFAPQKTAASEMNAVCSLEMEDLTRNDRDLRGG